MNISDKTSSNSWRFSRQSPGELLPSSSTGFRVKARSSLFRRLNICCPWLKIIASLIFALIILLNLSGVTVLQVKDPYDRIRIAPMLRHVRSTNRDLTGKKLVALTFDDGPSSATTPALLDRLSEKDVLATFFVLGIMAERSPELLVRAQKEGHELASHSRAHQNLIHLSPEEVQADTASMKALFQSVVGDEPSLTRPPYGNFDDPVRSSLGTPLILWSVDPLDWQEKDSAHIISTAKSQVFDGAIILMHDIYPTSVEAIPNLVDSLRQDGYEFVTISELAKARHTTLVPGEAYYKFLP